MKEQLGTKREGLASLYLDSHATWLLIEAMTGFGLFPHGELYMKWLGRVSAWPFYPSAQSQ